MNKISFLLVLLLTVLNPPGLKARVIQGHLDNITNGNKADSVWVYKNNNGTIDSVLTDSAGYFIFENQGGIEEIYKGNEYLEVKRIKNGIKIISDKNLEAKLIDIPGRIRDNFELKKGKEKTINMSDFSDGIHFLGIEDPDYYPVKIIKMNNGIIINNNNITNKNEKEKDSKEARTNSFNKSLSNYRIGEKDTVLFWTKDLKGRHYKSFWKMIFSAEDDSVYLERGLLPIDSPLKDYVDYATYRSPTFGLERFLTHNEARELLKDEHPETWRYKQFIDTSNSGPMTLASGDSLMGYVLDSIYSSVDTNGLNSYTDKRLYWIFNYADTLMNHEFLDSAMFVFTDTFEYGHYPNRPRCGVSAVRGDMPAGMGIASGDNIPGYDNDPKTLEKGSDWVTKNSERAVFLHEFTGKFGDLHDVPESVAIGLYNDPTPGIRGIDYNLWDYTISRTVGVMDPDSSTTAKNY